MLFCFVDVKVLKDLVSRASGKKRKTMHSVCTCIGHNRPLLLSIFIIIITPGEQTSLGLKTKNKDTVSWSGTSPVR